jgi:hypothetical protein
MTGSTGSNKLALLPNTPLLISESEDEFEALRSNLIEEINPRGIIEHMCVADIAEIVWESRRLHRCKAVMINMHYSAALKSLLRNVLVGDVVDYDHAEVLAQTWFTDKKAKKEVAEILRRFHLDESAIEAQAIKSVASELEILDKRLMSLETRRNRAIRNIAEYRESFARKVRESSGRIIEADSVVRLENLSGQKSA